MSLFSAMRSGVSGMSAQSSRMAAISDNINNSATVGYKRASVDFATLVTSSGSKTTYAAGGVSSNVRYQVLKDGVIQGTQSATDLAIDGRGFFVVGDQSGSGGAQYALTRAGSFLPDDEGYLRNTAGYYLQGWKLNPDGSLPAVNRTAFDSLESIRIGDLAYGGSASTAMTFSGNLPGQAQDGDSFTTTSLFYDGIGNGREVTLTWTKTAVPDQWEVDVTPPADYVLSGTPLPVTVDFQPTGPTAGLPVNPAVLDGIVLESNLGHQTVADRVTVAFGNVTQYNGDYVPQFIGDGARAAQVSSVSIDDGGTLWALYDNGGRRALYQIPIADVMNPDGLRTEGGNVYTLGSDSGALTLNAAGKGAVGSVASSALEQSNVDIADELVSLIETQRAYSSSATIVRTADEMVEETTRLKR